MTLMMLMLCGAGSGEITIPEPLAVEEVQELEERDARAEPLAGTPVGRCGDFTAIFILGGIVVLGGIAGLVLLLL